MNIAFLDGYSGDLTKDSTFTDAKWSIFYKFDTEIELDTFAALFPKYCKIKKIGCSSDIHGKGGFEFGAKCDLSAPTNKVTGDVNETAEKRTKKIKLILATIKGA